MAIIFVCCLWQTVHCAALVRLENKFDFFKKIIIMKIKFYLQLRSVRLIVLIFLIFFKKIIKNSCISWNEKEITLGKFKFSLMWFHFFIFKNIFLFFLFFFFEIGKYDIYIYFKNKKQKQKQMSFLCVYVFSLEQTIKSTNCFSLCRRVVERCCWHPM